MWNAFTPAEIEALMLSLQVAVVAVGAALPPAVAVAFLLARGRFPGRAFFARCGYTRRNGPPWGAPSPRPRARP